jgi:hypothetical protein
VSADRVVREQLLHLLRGGNAHLTFDQAVDAFPPASINARARRVGYSPWQLLEHLRLAQWDILEFIRNPAHVSPAWPEGYWPPAHEEADRARWQQTIEAIRADLAALEAIVEDPATDLYADLPHAAGYTVLREILLVADHNAYHIGEFAILRQVMDTWPADA